jgi:hypothetical protein
VPIFANCALHLFLGKNPLFLPQLLQKFIFPPRKTKQGKSSASSFQTVCFTSLESGFDGNFVSFLFISAESLKNHSKSQRNHKMENQILLDST